MSHLGGITCCSHVFSAKDIQGRVMGQKEALGTYDPNLYGGNVTAFAHTQCPECQKYYTLWMRPEHQSYKVITISKRDVIDTDMIDEPMLDLEEEKPKRNYSRRA